jgi:hypothetical protein
LSIRKSAWTIQSSFEPTNLHSDIRKPECTYYARIARIKRQVDFARLAHLLAAMLHWRNRLAALAALSRS